MAALLGLVTTMLGTGCVATWDLKRHDDASWPHPLDNQGGQSGQCQNNGGVPADAIPAQNSLNYGVEEHHSISRDMECMDVFTASGKLVRGLFGGLFMFSYPSCNGGGQAIYYDQQPKYYPTPGGGYSYVAPDNGVAFGNGGGAVGGGCPKGYVSMQFWVSNGHGGRYLKNYYVPRNSNYLRSGHPSGSYNQPPQHGGGGGGRPTQQRGGGGGSHR